MKILFLSLAAVLLFAVIAFGQSNSAPVCGSLDNPCELPCGATVTTQTPTRIYYEIMTPVSGADITMVPAAGVDYDLYVDTRKPTLSDYLCRPYLVAGYEEKCSIGTDPPSPIYVMVNHYSGDGAFSISAQCKPAVATTLDNYPNFLRSDSSYNVLVVVGSQATLDERAVGTTIANSLDLPSSSIKQDTEITDTDKENNNLILVGTPCMNSLVRDLADFQKFRYKCDNWPHENFGIIESIRDAFATYKTVVVVAGATINNQMLASSVLQSYSTKLSGVDANAVKVTGTSVDDTAISTDLPPPYFAYTIAGKTYNVRLIAIATSGSTNVAVVEINGDTYNLYQNSPVMINNIDGVMAVALHVTIVGMSGGGTADIILGPINTIDTGV